MQKLYQSCYVSHNETLKPDKRFCYDFVIRIFFHLASFFGSSTADYLVPRPSIPHRGTASVYLLLFTASTGYAAPNMLYIGTCTIWKDLVHLDIRVKAGEQGMIWKLVNEKARGFTGHPLFDTDLTVHIL